MKALRFAMIFGVLVACSDSSFLGSSSKAGKKPDSVLDQAASDADGGDGGSADAEAFGSDGSAVCINEESPVKFMILLDTTGSMEPSFDFVARSMQKLASAFKTIVPKGGTKPLADVAGGLVIYKDFEDGAPELITLTNDMEALKAKIETYRTNVRGGGDGPENGLNALQIALDHLAAQSSADAVKVTLVITDNFSHNDKALPPAGVHDYNLQPIVENFKKSLFQRLFIYDVTPTQPPLADLEILKDLGIDPEDFLDPNVPWKSPAEEWVKVRDGWKGIYAGAKYDPGRGFGFPFPNQTVVINGETPPPTTDEVDQKIIESLTSDLKEVLQICK